MLDTYELLVKDANCNMSLLCTANADFAPSKMLKDSRTTAVMKIFSLKFCTFNSAAKEKCNNSTFNVKIIP